MQSQKEKPSIFGIDILPHSSPQATLAFSLVIIRGSQVSQRYEHVSLSRLIRLTRSWQPRFIAMDNVYELGSNSSQLLKIISQLPPETQIVQVTGSPKEGLKQLHILAGEHGMSLPSKASPLQTAETGARLVSIGVGYTLEAYKHRTSISVTKGRVFGPGGMSQQRYKRRLCLAVLQVAHKIREGLKTQAFDYELTVRRSRWGYESCHFIVYADRKQLYGIAKVIRGPDVRVNIEPIMAGELEFKPLVQGSRSPPTARTRPTIVGIDPGVVTGVAMISLEGEILSLYSRRGLDRATIIESLTSIGHPILVCSDVSPPPDTVRKIAAALDSRVFYPESPMSTIEKREITQRYIENTEAAPRVEDTHQRDALAASLKAYMNLKITFEEADSRIREAGLRVSRDLVRAEIVRGATIAEAIELATPIPPPPERRIQQQEDDDQLLNVRIRSLEDRLRSQRELVEKLVENREELESKTSILSGRVKELELQLEREKSTVETELKRDREIESLITRVRGLETDFQNETLEKEAAKYKFARARELLALVLKGQVRFLKPTPSMTRQSVDQAGAELSIGKDDIVIVLEPATATLQGAQSVTTRQLRGVIAFGELPQIVLDFLEGHGIPVMEARELNVEEFEGLYYVDKTRLEGLLKASMDRIEAKERQANREMLDDLLDEYRRQRSRSS